MQNKFSHAAWDKEESTYFVLTKFENGKASQVYSKKIGMSERNDKTALLTNWICRMYHDGYLNQNSGKRTTVEQIIFYLNQVEPVEFLALTYSSYSILETSYFQNDRLINFLDKFYTLAGNNASPEEITNKLYVRARTAYIDPLDTLQKRFTAPQYLANYCSDLLKRKANPIPEQAIKDFFINYMEKHFNKRVGPESLKEWIEYAKRLNEFKNQDNGNKL